MDFCMPRQIQLKKNGKVLIERIDFSHTVIANLLDTGKALAPLKSWMCKTELAFMRK